MCKTKICGKCKIPKPLDEFHKHRNGKYGVDGRCKECNNLHRRNKYANDVQYKERAYRRGRKNLYNLNDVELDKLLIITNCEICGNKFKSKRDKHIDHNHNTGKVRGVLCNRCNTMLGYFENNLHLVDNIITYLNKDS